MNDQQPIKQTGTPAGRPTRRVEGRLKVTGEAKYAADRYPDGTLHAVLVGSPVAAGRIRSLDIARAQSVPGVVRVLKHGDLPGLKKVAMPLAIAHTPLHTDEIQWEGQPIAMVLGESIEAAEEAAMLVHAEIERGEAMTPGHGRVEAPPKEGAMWPASIDKGDLAAGVARSSHRVEGQYSQPTRHHNPMETSACVAEWEGDALILWDATQFSQAPAQALGAALGMPPEKIRVIAPHTGGGFGVKGFVWPHELLAAQAAKLAGRPVRLQLTRSQMYSMVGHQAECRQTIELAADAEGRLQAMRHRAVNTTSIEDTQSEGPGMATHTYYASPSISIDHQLERIHLVRSCPMRSPVEGPGSWALESAMDELAHELGIDPLELRLLNFAEREPVEDKPWSSNKLREAYAQAAEAFGWHRRHSLPRRDGVWTLGRGMAMGSTFCARFPSQARVRVHADGTASVESSANDIGTGNQTVMALLAAEALGIDHTGVTVRWGDTRLPAAGPVYGSSHTMGIGAAVRAAACDVRRQLVAIGAPESGPIDLASVMRGRGGELVGEGAFGLPDGAPASVNGSGTPYAMQTWGATFIELGVDADLGIIRLRRAVARYSAGRILNPLTARSQMIGGIIWEWGKATMEASLVEPRHARFLSKNLSGVAIPVNADIPLDAIDVGFVDEVDEHASPIGGKGIGELASCGVAAAIANAVFDAVGVRVREVPILPHHLLGGLRKAA